MIYNIQNLVNWNHDYSMQDPGNDNIHQAMIIINDPTE